MDSQVSVDLLKAFKTNFGIQKEVEIDYAIRNWPNKPKLKRPWTYRDCLKNGFLGQSIARIRVVDHEEAFQTVDGNFCLVFHPYEYDGDGRQQLVEEFVKTYGLTMVREKTGSWYHPQTTLYALFGKPPVIYGDKGP